MRWCKVGHMMGSKSSRRNLFENRHCLICQLLFAEKKSALVGVVRDGGVGRSRSCHLSRHTSSQAARGTGPAEKEAKTSWTAPPQRREEGPRWDGRGGDVVLPKAPTPGLVAYNPEGSRKSGAPPWGERGSRPTSGTADQGSEPEGRGPELPGCENQRGRRDLRHSRERGCVRTYSFWGQDKSMVWKVLRLHAKEFIC